MLLVELMFLKTFELLWPLKDYFDRHYEKQSALNKNKKQHIILDHLVFLNSTINDERRVVSKFE